MKLVDSLLDAISRLEGDALIMHVGEKPYVVTTSASMYAYRGPVAWGHVELSSRVLTTEAVMGMLEQLLPADQRRALDEYGAIEFELPESQKFADRFTVVAARGGEDVWLEIRRTPAAIGAVEAAEAVVAEAPPAAVSEPQPVEAVAVPEVLVEAPAVPEVPVETQPGFAAEPAPALATAEEFVAVEPEPVVEVPAAAEEVGVAVEAPVPIVTVEVVAEVPADVHVVVSAAPQPEPAIEPAAAAADIPAMSEPEPEPELVLAAAQAEEDAADPFEIVEEEPQLAPTQEEVDALLMASASALLAPRPVPAAEPEAVEGPVPAAEPVGAAPLPAPEPEPQPVIAQEPVRAQEPVSTPEPVRSAEPVSTPEPARPELVMAAEPEPWQRIPEETRQAVVLPLARSPIASEPPAEVRTATGTPLERVLRIASARGAATVYVVAQSRPVIRVDGEISVLDGEPVLTAAEVERLVMDLAPARARDSAPAGEWMADVPEVGRVRCLTFRDHRGPGVIFRMIPPKAISADQLGIPPEVQALCAQPDGLVLVTGARSSGKSTLLSAFVDLINRTRSDHVITIESQIGFVHESRRSFVSQREVRGDSETAAGAVRSAFREDPDVLVIEDMRTPEIASAAIEAAESGRLVFGSVSAPSTVAALDRMIEMFPLDRRAQAQTSLAGALRGIVAQTLLRKVRGGRVAAREILLNTPAVASLIADGKTFQLPVALDSGRRHGMMPLADSLAALVRDGTVHAAEAYRKAWDRDALLSALRRDGVDTSFAERLA